MLNRRRFLLLSSLALGACSARPIAQSVTNTPGASASASSVLSDAAVPKHPLNFNQPIGPADLFAPKRGDVRAVVISDLNSRYGSVDYRQEVMKGVSILPQWEPDIVLCVGDMVAGQSNALSKAEVDAMWQGFDHLILSPIREADIPFALTIGNHDASSLQDGGQYVYPVDREVTSRYWQAHQDTLDLQYVDTGNFPYYYSFKQNDIFYLVWDASSANVPADQVAWADRQLSSAAAQEARFRIALGHLPLYAISQGRDRNGELLNNAAQLQALLERHNVHTYMSGHHHAYYPGHAGDLQLLHTGALGSGPRTWLNRNDAAMQTMTVLDFFFDTGDTVYTTYNMNRMELVDARTLPRQIVGPTGRVLRNDIALADLTAEEQSQTHVRSEN
ncbi:metallophosphoesterase [Leptolyngbya cf. ectocarpi LEGE 11479]|uniref:Metallophosphoesterase n=1 Tax=Leptolyngbya cf. ectocarpi LEGE 11479 TaxID=1828722 RepID=A0A928ZQ81_LEPEC|nr:metallophosphoesterase [Leptolyngbya ectocarpi]MBE9065980.1 metallophosphoesterase [Leptolyngbya cf. ectocarpi LEGE 11479]